MSTSLLQVKLKDRPKRKSTPLHNHKNRRLEPSKRKLHKLHNRNNQLRNNKLQSPLSKTIKLPKSNHKKNRLKLKPNQKSQLKLNKKLQLPPPPLLDGFQELPLSFTHHNR
jgi:hypothetical protein